MYPRWLAKSFSSTTVILFLLPLPPSLVMMPLRCFLFSSDEGTVAIVRQILSSLGVDGEFCSNAVTAAEKITNENFQIVIIDWDQQPEAGVLLNTARERKAAERPLTLAIVSDEASAPHALHAGANSLLRKPIVASQAKETLTTARDLLRAKQGLPASASPVAAAAAAPTSSTVKPSAAIEPAEAKPARPPGLLQNSGARPSTLFEAEIKAPRPQEKPVPPPVGEKAEEKNESAIEGKDENDEASSDAPGRGLQWYLKTRVSGPASAGTSSAPAPAPEAPASRSQGNPDLIGFEQTSAYVPKPEPVREAAKEPSVAAKLDDVPRPPQKRETRKEPELFSFVQGKPDHCEPAEVRSGFKKRAIAGAVVLAAMAMVVAPQAPWHPKLQSLWRNGRQSIHAWFYPQPATPAPAPMAHENFTRAGDEYKLPVPETIPDATTDPSQIQVVPVVDPTAKKPNDGSIADKPVGLPAEGLTPSGAAPQSPETQLPEVQETGPAPVVIQPAAPAPVPTHPTPTVIVSAPAATATHSDTTVVASAPVLNPPAPRPSQPRAPSIPANIPQSLKSQLASTTPEPGGNKAPETALPSIEPVSVPEAQERTLLLQQQPPQYPANAKGQQGTVTLQVLIGRDGTVQDAKFLQGSLVFARAAIDSVKQWKFKPYLMNTRPVSVQTTLTLKFKPGQ
jgi:protein TonB